MIRMILRNWPRLAGRPAAVMSLAAIWGGLAGSWLLLAAFLAGMLAVQAPAIGKAYEASRRIDALYQQLNVPFLASLSQGAAAPAANTAPTTYSITWGSSVVTAINTLEASLAASKIIA